MKCKYLLALFFTISCAVNPKIESLNQLPNWYITPQSFDSQNLYGTGEGFTIAESSKSALNNLAGKLITTISSNSSLLMESNLYSINEQSRRKINEEVAKITFNNYQVSRSAIFNAQIYSEITVNRADFIANYSQKLDLLNKQMSEIFTEAHNKTILEKFNHLKQVNGLSLEAEIIASVLNSLGEEREIDLYKSYQRSYHNLSSKMEFFIEDKKLPLPLKQKVISNLTSQNLKIVKNKNLKNPNLIIVKINVDSNYKELYGSHIVRLRLDFNLISNQNKIIKSSSVENTGSSTLEKEAAMKAAINGIKDFNLF
ncbi:MAG: hypothetical protein ACJAW3_000782 [Lentimonas sp.]|jgi:hypothetical protein